MKRGASKSGPKLGASASARESNRSDPCATKPTTLCVVERVTAIRQLTVNFLNSLEGLSVIRSAATFEEGINACATLHPDVAIVDGCTWSESQGVSLSRAIQGVSPQTKILVFCPSAHPDLLRDAVEAGVPGFVLRSNSAATLEQAIRAVADGDQFYCAEYIHLLRQQRRRAPSAPSTTLTPRERRVLQEIARGRLSKEIADSLGMSVFGVQNVRRRLTRKTGLRSVAQLTLHAAKLRLVPEPDQR